MLRPALMVGSSSAMIGTTAGAVLGMLSFFVLYGVASSLEKKAEDARAPEPPAAGILKIAAWADLVISPVAGYIVGPMIWG